MTISAAQVGVVCRILTSRNEEEVTRIIKRVVKAAFEVIVLTYKPWYYVAY